MVRSTTDRRLGLSAGDPGNIDRERRAFLQRAGHLFLGSLVVSTVGGVLSCELHGEIPRVSGGLRSFVSPTEAGRLGDEFYIQFGNPTTNVDNHPRLRPEDWSLSIRGAVERDVTITFDDLMAAADTEAIEFLKTMRCVLDAPSQPLISNGYWRGVPLRTFLEVATPLDSAVRLYITGEDGFADNLFVDRVVRDSPRDVADTVPLLPVMLAFELNGQPIPTVHGGPARIIVPEKFGYKNMKWPRDIELTERDEPFGFYETVLFPGNAATDVGNIQLVSMFSGPIEGEAVEGPDVRLFGLAMFGPGEVEEVLISVDGGPMESAHLFSIEELLSDVELFFGANTGREAEDLGNELDRLRGSLIQLNDPRFEGFIPFVWRLFRFDVRLSPGTHTARVSARATGPITQPERDTDAGDGNSQVREVEFVVF